MRPNRASIASTAPLDELLSMLLRQFRRPLASHHVTFTDREAENIVRTILERGPLDDKAIAVRDALVEIVAESEQVLARWNLTFEQSLDTGMDQITGWETTADFLEIANEKSNAELRIGGAATLLAALGDLRYARYLLFLAGRGDEDVDVWLARRILQFISGIDGHAPDWRARVEQWLEQAQHGGN